MVTSKDHYRKGRNCVKFLLYGVVRSACAPSTDIRQRVIRKDYVITYDAMSSSVYTSNNYRMRTELTNNNKLMMKHKIAITYSTCCTSVKKANYD